MAAQFWLSLTALLLAISSFVFTYKTYKANLKPNLWLGKASENKLAICNLGARAVLVSGIYESFKWDNQIHQFENQPYLIIEPNKSVEIEVLKPAFGNAHTAFIEFEYIYGSTDKTKHSHFATVISTSRKGQYILFQGKDAKLQDLRNRKKIVNKAVDLRIDHHLVLDAAPDE